jgi:two-component system NarL family response regulator
MGSQPPQANGKQQGEAPEQTLPLSDRQLQILALVAEGRTDNEIALQLYISVKTVTWHVSNARTRLQARSRTHAVVLAMQQGLLPGHRSPEQET